MRFATVSQMKGRGTGPMHQAPALGSYMRDVFDILQVNKGVPVELPGTPRKLIGVIRQFQDFYGLDVRLFQRGSHREGWGGERPTLYLLAGEWFGRVYVDYVAERIAAHQSSSHPEHVS